MSGARAVWSHLRSCPVARSCGIAALYLVVAVVATWPLALHITTHVPAGAYDLFQNVWNFWWWKAALFDLQVSPYRTDLLFAPDGLDLAFHTHSEFNMLATMPVNVLLGHVAAYNVSVLLAVALCGIGGYLLLRELWDDAFAALGGGLFFALLPQHLEQLFEHLNLFSCQFMPLALLFLIRTCRSGSGRDGILAGLFFALNALCGWHLGLFAILIGAPVALFYLARSPCRLRAIAWLGAGAVAATAALLPFLWPMLRELVDGTAYFKKPLVYRPIDAAFLAIPPPQSTLLGGLVQGIYETRRGDASAPGTMFLFQYAGFICFLGWIPLALIIWRAARLRRHPERGQVVFWAALALVFAVFALGAYPTLFGVPFPRISLPQGLTQELPGFRVLRVANRYLIPASLALSVLLAAALAALAKRPALRGALVALMALEFLWVPFPLERYPTYPHLATLAGDPRTGIVLDIPICTGAATVENMTRQTYHRSPLVGGYASCVPPATIEVLASMPDLQGLVLAEGRGGMLPPPALTRAALNRLKERGIGTIIVKPGETREQLRAEVARQRELGVPPFFLRRSNPARGLPEAQVDRIVEALETTLGPPAYEDEAMMVWHL